MVRSRERALDRMELRELFKACENDQELLLVKGLAFTGMRIGEFLHLNEEWINWKRK